MSDIIDRLRFDATRCEMHFSKGVAGNIEEAAAEIERLRKFIVNVGLWPQFLMDHPVSLSRPDGKDAT